MSPFFSVCIPSTNREKTIAATLHSLSEQTFSDFEVIIVDCNSKDNTIREIESYLRSEKFKARPFSYQLVQRAYEPKTVEDWNEPVRLAKGKYIAMLEGDDQFLPGHLAKAYDHLKDKNNIGIYATGNQIEPRKKTGFISSGDYLKYLYSLQEIPPPSEAIFIREDKNGVPFLYNEKDYVYAPEIDLYIRICSTGFDAFIAPTQNVIRDRQVKSKVKWKYFQDHYLILEKYKHLPGITDAETRHYQKSIDQRAYSAFLYDLLYYKTSERRELKRRLMKKDGMPVFYLNVLNSFTRIIVKTIAKRFGKG